MGRTQACTTTGRSGRVRESWAAALSALAIALTGSLATVVVTGGTSAHAADAGSVSGRVNVPDGDRSWISVELIRAPASPAQVDGYEWIRSDITSVVGAGTFTFTDVAPGEYTLKFMSLPAYATQYWGNETDRSKVRTFTVAAGQQVTGLSMKMSPSATVTGRVKFPAGPVKDAFVEVQRWQADPRWTSGGRWEDAVIPTRVPVAADGTWTIRGLGAERYRLVFLSPGNSTVVWNHVPGQPNWRYVTTSAGKTTRLDDHPPAKKIVRRKSPDVTGTAKVGRTLKAAKGTWRSSVGAKTTVTLRWETKKGSKAVKVKGATSSKLKLSKKFRGKQVRVRVTVRAKGHPSVVRTTKWSKKVR